MSASPRHFRHPAFIDMTGAVLHGGRVTVVRRAANANGNARWQCRCACGHDFIKDGIQLRESEKRGHNPCPACKGKRPGSVQRKAMPEPQPPFAVKFEDAAPRRTEPVSPIPDAGFEADALLRALRARVVEAARRYYSAWINDDADDFDAATMPLLEAVEALVVHEAKAEIPE